MRTLGFVTRAVVIEVIAVVGIVWFATSDLPLIKSPTAQSERSVAQIARPDTSGQQRTSYVQSRLERLAGQLRSNANQLVDEALATWFRK